MINLLSRVSSFRLGIYCLLLRRPSTTTERGRNATGISLLPNRFNIFLLSDLYAAAVRISNDKKISNLYKVNLLDTPTAICRPVSQNERSLNLRHILAVAASPST